MRLHSGNYSILHIPDGLAEVRRTSSLTMEYVAKEAQPSACLESD